MKSFVPALRFNEWSDSWKNNKLRQIAVIKSGSTPARSNAAYFINGDLPWVKTTDLNNSEIFQTEEKVTPLALQETSLRKNPIDTVLVAMYGGFNQIGRTGILQVESATNQALSVINTDSKYLFPRYLVSAY